MTGELSAPSKVLFEALREQLRIANDLAANSGRQLEVERQLVEAGRKRLDELQTVLADALTAQRIAADEAAALRAIVTGLSARPWWRRWFRRACYEPAERHAPPR